MSTGLPTEDTVAILQLYARYNTAIDTGDGEGFAGCFVPDGVFQSPLGVSTGHEEIAAFCDDNHKMLPDLRHMASNIVVDGAGDEATGSAYLIGYRTAGGFQVIVTGRYRDTLARTPEGWRFVERTFTADGA